MPPKVDILQLPDEILENILSYMTYDTISHMRIVCKKFDQCCQRLLNRGFLKVERYHSACLRDIKAQLPRRESERRDHALARHSDILTAIETRLSLLGMTFMKYVDMNLCSFIPGKVIDEIYNVLRYVQSTPTPPRSHEILQELRDISSMAMEHFDEHIAPLLKQKIGANRRTIALSSPSNSLSLVPSMRATGTCNCATLRRELARVQLSVKQLNTSGVLLKKDLTDTKVKLAQERKRNKEQDKQLTELNQIIVELREQLVRVNEQEGKISELNQKLAECEKRISDFPVNRTELQVAPCIENKQGSSSNKTEEEAIENKIQADERKAENWNKSLECFVKTEKNCAEKKQVDEKKKKRSANLDSGKTKSEKRQKTSDSLSSSKRSKHKHGESTKPT